MFLRGQGVLMLLILVTVPALPLRAADPKGVRTDRYGDPLPPGAVARLGTLRLWHQGRIESIAFSPDGTVLASAGGWGTTYARLWDTATGKEIRRISGTSREALEVVRFSHTGRLVAGVSPHEAGRNIFLWEAVTGKLLHRLANRQVPREDHFYRRGNIAFLDGDKTLVAVDAEGSVGWWDVTTGKKVREWNAMQAVAKPSDPGAWKFKRAYRATLTRDGRVLAGIIEWKNDKADKKKRDYQRQLIVWDLDQRKERWHLLQGEDNSFAFDLSADGAIAAVGVNFSEVSIRDGVTGRELHRLKGAKKYFANPWESLALSRDGKRVAALDDGTSCLCVWDVASGEALHQVNRWSTGYSISPPQIRFSPDGKSLAFSWGDTVALREVSSWSERPRREGHREPVLFLSFSADGKTLVSGNGGHPPPCSFPEMVVTWDTITWRETTRSELAPDDRTLYVSRDHRLGVIQTDEGHFFITAWPSGNKLRRLKIRSKGLLPTFSDWAGWFSPSGKTVVQVIPKSGPKDDLALVDVASGEKRGALSETLHSIKYMAFSLDDQTMAWLDKQAVVHVVAVDGGKELRRLGVPRQGGINHNIPPMLTFSPDGRHLAFWERDIKDIVIWDWRTGKEHRQLPGRGGDSWYEVCLAYSPDGRCLAVGGMASEHDVELWELETGQLRRRIPGHLGPVRSLAFSPDGRLLASGSDDTTVLVWDLYGLSLRGRRTEQPTPARLQSLWTDLAHADARRAAEAMTVQMQESGLAISFLSQRLQPASAADPEKVTRWIADLDSSEFAVRRKAAQELEQLAELAEPALRKALAGKPSLEARRRIEGLLDKLDHLPPEKLRLLRAVEVLEHLGTPEARKLLQRLADGAPAARLTQEAKASLERLARSTVQP